MKKDPQRLGEADITFPVLVLIARNTRGISVSDLIIDMGTAFPPQGRDREIATNRSDMRYAEAIRNIVSHRHDSTQNIIYRGLVAYAPGNGGWLAITDKGQADLDRRTRESGR